MYEASDLIKEGKDLEILVSSYYQAYDYYVESNLKWIEDKEDLPGKVNILELDVLAKMFSIHSVERTLIECKRGCTYKDIFKFSGVAKLVGANSNVLICQSHDIDKLKSVGDRINIQVKTPEDLLTTLSDDQQEKLSFFHASNSISNQLFEKETIKSIMTTSGNFSVIEQRAYNMIRSYMAELIGKIWKEPDLIQQSIQIKNLLDTHSDYVREIARFLQIKPGNESSEFYMKKNMLCRAAGYLALKVRVSYVICAIHCAVALGNGVVLELDKIQDDSFLNVVHLSRKELATAVKIPQFLQEFIYIFGGMTSLLDKDAYNIAQYMKMDFSEMMKIIGLLKQLFKLSENRIQWGFVEDMGVLYLKYVPTPIKGLGVINREKLDYSINEFCFVDEWKKSLSIYRL
ncbi:hypothetical protein KKA86_04030 [bacterium]|nr:hypothetical protein [bacterium]